MTSDRVGGQVPAGVPGVVFFVDDDEEIRSFVATVLNRSGYTVLGAGSAEEAGRVVDGYEGRIDVLLMDVNLPDAWGSTLAQSLRVVHPEMALVFTTGYASSDEVLAGGLHDATRVLPKPFTVEALLSVVRDAILDPGGRPHGRNRGSAGDSNAEQ